MSFPGRFAGHAHHCPPPTPGVVLEQSAWTIDRPGGGLWLGQHIQTRHHVLKQVV